MNNIFHVLGINTATTPRKLRRRRENLEAAHALGDSAWTKEFKHMFGRKTPTWEEVCEAFDRIENPEERIVSEFFWFWIDDEGSALDALLTGHETTAIKAWEKEERTDGKTRFIAIHNLAILYHLYAIDAELQLISYGKSPPADFHSAMCKYWDKSFSYWEQLVDDDDFWDLFARRVREFDSQRLTGGFVRRFRREFPVVFDNINARLAAEYAKKEAYEEAKRHVSYMLKTMSGLDDVDTTLDVLFEPMERKVKRLVENFDSKVEQSAKQGLECARQLLAETKEICHVVIGLLSEGQKTRTRLLSDIVYACNNYLVSYGNTTKDWKSCLEGLEQLQPLACTEELKEKIETNLKTVRQNLTAEIATTTSRLNALVGKIERQIEFYDVQIEQSPEQGLEFSRILLAEADHFCCFETQVSTSVFRVFKGIILPEIVGACNNYLVSYGNTTKDWKSCLEGLEQLQPLACTEELKEKIETNLKTVRQNLTAEIETSTSQLKALEGKIKRQIEYYDVQIARLPEQGLEFSRVLLADAQAICCFEKKMSSSEYQRVKESIFPEIVGACYRYIQAYGKATNDWTTCFGTLEQLRPFAYKSNLKVKERSEGEVSHPKLHDDGEEMCWFCTKRKADQIYHAKMFGDVQFEGPRIKYRLTTIEVPICSKCKKDWSCSNNPPIIVVFLVILLCIVLSWAVLISSQDVLGKIIMLLCVCVILFMSLGIVSLGIKHDAKKYAQRCKEYPKIKERLDRGWRFGDKPSSIR